MNQIDIKGWENYQITDDGRVWSKKNNIYLSTNRKDGNGYPQVAFYKEGKQFPINIHRLVAEAFIPNPENKPCIDHINGCKTDNRVENLRWCSYKENMANPLTYEKIKGANIGRYPSEETRKKMSEHCTKYWLGKHLTEETKRKMAEAHKGKIAYNRKPVVQCSIDGEVIKKWDCINDAANNGFTSSSIIFCCQGKQKTHKGFIWKYIST